MLTKSVESVISVVLKHVALAKKSVLSVSDSNILLSGKTTEHKKTVTDNVVAAIFCDSLLCQ